MSQCSNSIDLLIIYNGRTGLDKLCARSPPFFACTKLRARKSIKTSLSSIRMLFKVVSNAHTRKKKKDLRSYEIRKVQNIVETSCNYNLVPAPPSLLPKE